MAKALSITRHVEIIDKKKFVKTALNKNVEAFVVYIAFLLSKILIYPTWTAQIALLLAKKVTILTEYLDFTNVFSKKISCRAFQALRYQQTSLRSKAG